MEIDRRNLMKCLLAGGALLAIGSPSWAFADRSAGKLGRCLIFLGGNPEDDLFLNGVRAACAETGYDRLETAQVNGGLLSDSGKLVSLLEQTKGTRWIAVLDDASAAVFQELSRTAGGRLLSVGSHVSGSNGRLSRHAWLAASPAQGAGGFLAVQLGAERESFSITESFLSESSTARRLTSWSAPGFSSYRPAGSEAMHLHCSGLSVPEACQELGLTGLEDWTSIPPHVCTQETVARQSPHWAESVGYAVGALALGMRSIQESCSTRAFVHRPGGPGRRQSSARFVSFVMDL